MTSIFYWDDRGRLRKSVEELTSPTGPGAIIARYYEDCRLILARSAPARQAKPRPEQIEKYYFRKGRLLRIVSGYDVKAFPKEQWDYYERVYGGESAECTRKAEAAP